MKGLRSVLNLTLVCAVLVAVASAQNPKPFCACPGSCKSYAGTIAGCGCFCNRMAAQWGRTDVTMRYSGMRKGSGIRHPGACACCYYPDRVSANSTQHQLEVARDSLALANIDVDLSGRVMELPVDVEVGPSQPQGQVAVAIQVDGATQPAAAEWTMMLGKEAQQPVTQVAEWTEVAESSASPHAVQPSSELPPGYGEVRTQLMRHPAMSSVTVSYDNSSLLAGDPVGPLYVHACFNAGGCCGYSGYSSGIKACTAWCETKKKYFQNDGRSMVIKHLSYRPPHILGGCTCCTMRGTGADPCPLAGMGSGDPTTPKCCGGSLGRSCCKVGCC